MGGIARLAHEMGITVTGSDAHVYPPMSDQLQQLGIKLLEGYDPKHLDPEPDLVVIGNALSRGNPCVEHVLNRGLKYISGPAFLAQHILAGKWVLAAAGTHGKTTTSSMLAWILEDCGLAPGYLIGGIPKNFTYSARLGDTPFFVVEADEYDTAFFDKRSKFIHYQPRTAILNNLEYDHADIFPNVEAIERQFHHLIRTIPNNGLIVLPNHDAHLQNVLKLGVWTPTETIETEETQTNSTIKADHSHWRGQALEPDYSHFSVYCDDTPIGEVKWPHCGQHNMTNALAALAAARHVGIIPSQGVVALNRFAGVKRRLELRAEINAIRIYDDFAHHPTAIKTTLNGIRQRTTQGRVIAVLEPRSNTMRMGVHQNTLAQSLEDADHIMLFQPAAVDWNMTPLINQLKGKAQLYRDTQDIIDELCHSSRSGDQIVIMSNGGFEGIHQRLIDTLQQQS